MATIIKRESQSQMQSTGKAVRGVAYDLTDMASQADDYLAGVRAEAAKIIQQAKQEAVAIKKQAEEAGRKAAQEAVEKILDEKVAQQMKTLTPALATAVEQIKDSEQAWIHHWETSLVQLAGAIAARLVRREIQRHPEIALEWIEEALRLAAGSAEITVRLHPTDLETLAGQVERLAETFNTLAPAKVVADESISLGGCRVETEFGSIDQQIETQLQRIADELG